MRVVDIITIIIIQGVSRLVDISVADDLLGFCDEKCLYKHVSDFGLTGTLHCRFFRPRFYRRTVHESAESL